MVMLVEGRLEMRPMAFQSQSNSQVCNTHVHFRFRRALTLTQLRIYKDLTLYWCES